MICNGSGWNPNPLKRQSKKLHINNKYSVYIIFNGKYSEVSFDT